MASTWAVPVCSPSLFESQNSLVLEIFATVPSYTSTKVAPGVSSDGRIIFVRPVTKECFGPGICILNLSLFILLKLIQVSVIQKQSAQIKLNQKILISGFISTFKK